MLFPKWNLFPNPFRQAPRSLNTSNDRFSYHVLEDRRVLAPAFAQFVDPNPAPGNQFGEKVVPLSTGNVVITSPGDDAGGLNAGAVYLFNGSTGALISTLKGSTATDLTNVTVTQLNNGNYVLLMSNWDNGSSNNAGAVTWASGTAGINGVVSAGNSLVGSAANDQIGTFAILPLINGNYVVVSSNWDNGAITDAGAVTWGSGTNGVKGVISAGNSLVGTTANDKIGLAQNNQHGVVLLTNGNYVVRSQNWNDGVANLAGAVTWGSGTSGVKGAVNSNNSLIGATAYDQVGGRVTALSNGNYVVSSSGWDNGTATDVGAVTWGNGTTGISGVVGVSNSLVGSTIEDRVGGVTALSNGNYVVSSPSWDNGTATDAGAVTWGNGTTGISGVVGVSNSLVGSKANDQVGLFRTTLQPYVNGVTALSNGNYVVTSFNWDNGSIVNVGAVTWGNGATGISGVVGVSNSLVGPNANDQAGSGGVTVLSNGNYVVYSREWDNGAAYNAGAITWGSGTSGVIGFVNASNSLVGSSSLDVADSGNRVTPLSSGNYVVHFPNWDNGPVGDVGAVTWANGMTGISGLISPGNSLIGSTAGDRVGGGVTVLSNGNYVVRSVSWDNGTVTDAGAVTWGDGVSGITGVVSVSNSLVGSSANDGVGSGGVTVLTNGNFVVRSSYWDNGGATDAGAVTWGSGISGVSGVVSASNSLVGSSNDDLLGISGLLGGSTLIALSNGNYVIGSAYWDNGPLRNAGAATWGNGATGTSGVVGISNSLVGGEIDQVGAAITPLPNGDYVLRNPFWNSGTIADVGAVTLCNGTIGSNGVISANNSLVGSVTNDQVGSGGIDVLSNGNYVVHSPVWNNGADADAGAVTWVNGTLGVTGNVSAANSIFGSHLNTGLSTSVLDNINQQFYSRFTTERSGIVRVGSFVDGFQQEASLHEGYVFYNESGFQSALGSNGAIDPIHDGGTSVPHGKDLLKSRNVTQTTSLTNVSNYNKGINGLVFDVNHLASNQLTASDFIFRRPAGLLPTGLANPRTWNGEVPAPTSIKVVPLSGFQSRVTIQWADNAIENTWLQVVLRANANTGLLFPVVYYLGHAKGEVTGMNAVVNQSDLSAVQGAISGAIVPLSNLFDINKDRYVTTADANLVSSYQSKRVILNNITIPAAGSFSEGAWTDRVLHNAGGNRQNGGGIVGGSIGDFGQGPAIGSDKDFQEAHAYGFTQSNDLDTALSRLVWDSLGLGGSIEKIENRTQVRFHDFQDQLAISELPRLHLAGSFEAVDGVFLKFDDHDFQLSEPINLEIQVNRTEIKDGLLFVTAESMVLE